MCEVLYFRRNAPGIYKNLNLRSNLDFTTEKEVISMIMDCQLCWERPPKSHLSKLLSLTPRESKWKLKYCNSFFSNLKCDTKLILVNYFKHKNYQSTKSIFMKFWIEAIFYDYKRAAAGRAKKKIWPENFSVQNFFLSLNVTWNCLKFISMFFL